MTTNYPKELDEAQKLFWSNMMANVKNSTSKRILIKLEELEQKTDDVRGSFSAFWSGIGQALAERKAKKK